MVVEIAVAAIGALAMTGTAYVGVISVRADRRLARLETDEAKCREELEGVRSEMTSMHSRLTLLEPPRHRR